MDWLPVVGFERYEVSNAGSVRRVVDLPRHPATGKTLRGTIDPTTGYLKVNLRRDGMRTTRAVHVLVCEAFIGPRPGGADVRHLNGDKTDNAISNLAYGTRSENNLDAVRHRTNANTAKTHCPRGHVLSDPNLQAKKIGRSCRACGMARAAQQRAARRGRSFDFNATADHAYVRLMSGLVDSCRQVAD